MLKFINILKSLSLNQSRTLKVIKRSTVNKNHYSQSNRHFPDQQFWQPVWSASQTVYCDCFSGYHQLLHRQIIKPWKHTAIKVAYN